MDESSPSVDKLENTNSTLPAGDEDTVDGSMLVVPIIIVMLMYTVTD